MESIECGDSALTSLLALLASHLHVHPLTHARAYTHTHCDRDKWLVAVYSAAFVIVATVNLVMFVYLLVAVVIEVCRMCVRTCACISTEPLHSLMV